MALGQHSWTMAETAAPARASPAASGSEPRAPGPLADSRERARKRAASAIPEKDIPVPKRPAPAVIHIPRLDVKTESPPAESITLSEIELPHAPWARAAALFSDMPQRVERWETIVRSGYAYMERFKYLSNVRKHLNVEAEAARGILASDAVSDRNLVVEARRRLDNINFDLKRVDNDLDEIRAMMLKCDNDVVAACSAISEVRVGIRDCLRLAAPRTYFETLPLNVRSLLTLPTTERPSVIAATKALIQDVCQSCVLSPEHMEFVLKRTARLAVVDAVFRSAAAYHGFANLSNVEEIEPIDLHNLHLSWGALPTRVVVSDVVGDAVLESPFAISIIRETTWKGDELDFCREGEEFRTLEFTEVLRAMRSEATAPRAASLLTKNVPDMVESLNEISRFWTKIADIMPTLKEPARLIDRLLMVTAD
jgi:hypothetical protein